MADDKPTPPPKRPAPSRPADRGGQFQDRKSVTKPGTPKVTK